MPRQAHQFSLQSERARELAGALIPSDVARFASPRFRLDHELDPDAHPIARADRAAGIAYVATGRTVGTLLTLPVAAVAAVASIALAGAAIATVVGAVVTGAVGAVFGGAVGTVGWALRRNTSPRRGAIVGLGFASMGIGLPISIGLSAVSSTTAYLLTATSHGISRLSGAVAHRSARITRSIVAHTETAMAAARARVARTSQPAARPITAVELLGSPDVPAVPTVPEGPALVAAGPLPGPAATAPSVPTPAVASAPRQTVAPAARPTFDIDL